MEYSTNDFDHIYIEYYPQIHRYLISLIGEKEAEDVTQEVFIKAGTALHKFRNESQISTWLYRIATNSGIDRMRESSFRREVVIDPVDCGVSGSDSGMVAGVKADLTVNRLSLEEKALHNATSECIRGVIDELPENYRVPVILSELEGLPNQEIAEILGLSLEVVKVRLHRGKARLRKELMNACQFSRDEWNELTCDPKEAIREKSKPGTL